MSPIIQIAVAYAWLQAPETKGDLFLREPDYFIDKQGEVWQLRKPRLGSGPAWTVFEDSFFGALEQQKRILPRLRLSRPFVRFHPATNGRTTVADWSGAEDAKEAEQDIQGLIRRFATLSVQPLLAPTPIYMARLSGASGHTAEEWRDPRRYVVYLDPFRATGRLHAAATLIHELTHVERFQSRGFHANRAAAFLSKADFVRLGIADEFAAFEAEAQFIRSFSQTLSEPKRKLFIRDMPSSDLRWPIALILLLGFEAAIDETSRINQARKQVLLDLRPQAERYWDLHHEDRLDPALEQTIRTWYSESPEWRRIVAETAAP